MLVKKTQVNLARVRSVLSSHTRLTTWRKKVTKTMGDKVAREALKRLKHQKTQTIHSLQRRKTPTVIQIQQKKRQICLNQKVQETKKSNHPSQFNQNNRKKKLKSFLLQMYKNDNYLNLSNVYAQKLGSEIARAQIENPLKMFDRIKMNQLKNANI